MHFCVLVENIIDFLSPPYMYTTGEKAHALSLHSA